MLVWVSKRSEYCGWYTGWFEICQSFCLCSVVAGKFWRVPIKKLHISLLSRKHPKQYHGGGRYDEFHNVLEIRNFRRLLNEQSRDRLADFSLHSQRRFVLVQRSRISSWRSDTEPACCSTFSDSTAHTGCPATDSLRACSSR